MSKINFKPNEDRVLVQAAEAEEAMAKTNRGKNSPRKSRAIAAKRPRR